MSTKRKNRIYKVFLTIAMVFCVLAGSFFFANKVQAKDLKDAFSIDLEITSFSTDICTILVTVENNGKDWEGTVRLLPDVERGTTTAYDTIISLPQGSKKQFEVRIFRNSMSYYSDTITLMLINKKNEVILEENFIGELDYGVNSVGMGILSDTYSSLTYLDMGGEKITYWNRKYPIRLMEIKPDAVTANLESMQILVIDNFNTEIISDKDLQKLERWVENGGLLIVGTGAYAEETLSGLGDGFLEMEYNYVFSPAEGWELEEYNSVINTRQLHIASLSPKNRSGLYYNTAYFSNAQVSSDNMGAVAVMPYSFTELEQQGDKCFEYMDRETYVRNVLGELLDYAAACYDNKDNNSNDNMANMVQDLLNIIGNANNILNFGALRLIILAYVIIVGPMLYLILKVYKKREYYWGLVPAVTVLFIIIVFLAGKGFTVLNTHAYSVAVENLQEQRTDRTYLYAYDASHDEWSIPVSEEYGFASQLGWDYYDDSYGVHIVKEGDKLSLGFNPGQSFENSYYILGKKEDAERSQGALLGKEIEAYSWSMAGSVYNDTEYDFEYFAVMKDEEVFVYQDLSSGKECDLSDKEVLYHCSLSYGVTNRDYMYDFLYDIDEKQVDKISELAALGVGINDSYIMVNGDATIIVGVTKEAPKTLDGFCKELTYRCVYQVQ